MDINRAGSQPSSKGQVEYLTGTVRIDPLNTPPEPARVTMALVTIEPGARTAWHTHPLGRRGLVHAWREALARRWAGHGNESYRRPGEAERIAG